MSGPTYTGFAGGEPAGADWGEVTLRARALRNAYLAAWCRRAAAAIRGRRRGR